MKIIIFTLFVGAVLSQENLDKLILKDGTRYFGEYSKTYRDKVFFKPKNKSVYKRFPVEKIEKLQLEEGYILITGGYEDIHIWGREEGLNFSDSRDILYLKSGIIYRGRYKEKINDKIIFLVINDRLDRLEGYEDYTKSFDFNDVKTIIMKKGKFKLRHPFNFPRLEKYYKNSRGLSSEKNPFSIFEWSFYNELNKFSEFHFSINTFYFLTSGYSIGYKYYLRDKVKSSLFLSMSLFMQYNIVPGDKNYLYNGLNISPGFSSKGNKKFILGLSFINIDDGIENAQNKSEGENDSFKYLGVFPYFRIEKRF